MRPEPAEAAHAGAPGAGAAANAVVIECDGSSLGNPGAAGIGVRILGADGETLAERSESIGRTTNNVAEYTALIRALEMAAALGARRVAIRMDSELVVRQVRGEYKARDSKMQDLLVEAKSRLRAFEGWTILEVARGSNSRADVLAKAGALSKGGG